MNNGLYNMLFGENENADELLYFLGLNRHMFERYRDCYLNHDGTKITVVTRCGGNNRQDFDNVFDMMRQHNLYLTDYDDPVDETYCYFQFKVPYEWEERASKLATGEEPLTVGQKFNKEIKEINIPGSDAEKRAQKISAYINKQIDVNKNNGVIWMGNIE